MIYIDEKISDEFVTIKVDGILNYASLGVLEQVMRRNLEAEKRIKLDLEGLTYADRDGTNLLKSYKSRVTMEGLPEFMKMEISVSD